MNRSWALSRKQFVVESAQELNYHLLMLQHGHFKSDQRNLALHRAALDKLRQHPQLRQPVLILLTKWLDEQLPSHAWLEQWRDMLMNWSLDQISGLVLDQEKGQPLRQCSPLGPVLTPQERWQILAQTSATPSSE